jgi:hypothetical protein
VYLGHKHRVPLRCRISRDGTQNGWSLAGYRCPDDATAGCGGLGSSGARLQSGGAGSPPRQPDGVEPGAQPT